MRLHTATGVLATTAIALVGPSLAQVRPAEVMVVQLGEGTRFENAAGDPALRGPTDLQHYLQWGASGQAQEAAAVAAGKWHKGLFLESVEVGWLEGFGYWYDFEGDSWGSIYVIDSVVRAGSWAGLKLSVSVPQPTMDMAGSPDR